MRYEIKRHTGRFNLSERGGATIRYIVIHYTAAQTPDPPHALNNCQYFAGGNRNASADFFVDNRDIYQYNPDLKRYYTWQVGDGKGKYGITNRNSVGIEFCQIGDRPFTEAEIERGADLVQYLMAIYNVPAERVVRHYDASRKTCPEYYARRSAEWQALWRRLVGKDTPAPKPEPKRPEKGHPIMAVGGDKVFRLYNPYTNEHMLTTTEGERANLIKGGWTDEGVAFASEVDVPVYRLYNQWSKQHFFTASLDEANKLIDAGWTYEGVAMFGAKDGAPVYRLANGEQHLWTADANERDALVKQGWKSEGVGWNAPE